MEAAGKVREGRAAEKRRPPRDESEPRRGKTQEGISLVPGVTTGRGDGLFAEMKALKANLSTFGDPAPRAPRRFSASSEGPAPQGVVRVDRAELALCGRLGSAPNEALGLPRRKARATGGCGARHRVSR